jgi:outer membrane protein assembly factor BamB
MRQGQGDTFTIKRLDPEDSTMPVLRRPMATTRMLVRELSALLCLALAGTASAADWPQWGGPRRDGVWREDGILGRFPKDGPAVRWRRPVGPGFTGPAVANGYIYVMDRQTPKETEGKPGPGSERVLCLDAAKGTVVWQHLYDCPYKIYYPQGPRATPVVRDGRVYTLGAMGDLHCYDAASGKLLWERNFPRDFKAKPPAWGWSASPLLEGNQVYCLVGGEGSAVMSFDKDSGKELWRACTAEEIGYSTPLLCEAGGKRQLVVWLDASVNALDPRTGRLYWSVPHPKDGKPERPVVTVASPVRADQWLFISEFYKGSLMLRLDADKPAAAEAWRSKSDNPSKPDNLNAIMATPVIQDGHIYGICGTGELRCVKADTGKVVWETYAATGGKRALFANAFLVPQGDRFFLWNDGGDLIIARLTPKGYDEIGRANLLEPTLTTRGRTVVWSHPAFAGRCMYARNDKELICVSLAAAATSG